MKFVAPSNDPSATEAARREWLSALFDGECQPLQALSALDGADPGDDRATWDAYRCIGDALRAQASRAETGADPAFVRAVMAQVAAQPVPPRSDAPTVVVHPQPLAANDAVFRWKVAAGVAALAAVLAVAWQVGVVPGVVETAPRMAQAEPPQTQAVTAGPPSAATPVPAAVVRDPQLEELIAAHRQWGGASALQSSAGFLRAASYDVPAR
ncbi:MAG: sigma-E factor negative regulatory protein [Tepidimonas sp.]|uniref:sigma-E factor negative regulatory protein n=1 Tax=Tepidimonas sp. TaxID=2002775 RepID=UPI00259E9B92|nr:sigma-E factor negative regulatory protein [Tepidimonas sp.]MDM7457129.1 sigma-E factor negative regulatory protein [Tepidimonas sp.]